jgi:chromosome partitioning protein
VDVHVVIVNNSKGGSAKSTVAVHLATYARGTGQRALLIDADYAQQTLVCWNEIRLRHHAHSPLPSVPVVGVRIERIAEILNQAKEKCCDVVVVDTAPGQTNALTRIFELSDLILIPSQPTLFDIQGAKTTARLVHELGKPYRFMLTRVSAGHTKRVDLWRERYGAEGPLLQSQFTNRVAFQDAMVAGMGVSEWLPGCEAAREAGETFDCVRTILERPHHEEA